METTNIKVNLVCLNKTALETLSVENGYVYFVEDTKELFFDFDSKRNEVKDILILEKDADRTSILFIPLNKFYFCLDTQVLWLYKDGTWYQVSQDTDNFYTKQEIDEKGFLTTEDIINLATKDELATKANSSDVYTKQEIDSKISSVYRYKGSVESVEALPIDSNEIGDVYNVEDTGANYAWTGEEWDKLSETIDLSIYITKEEANSTFSTKSELEAKQDKLTAGANISIEDNIISATTPEVLIDEQTIVKSDSNKLQVVANITKDGRLKTDWIGTLEEYTSDKSSGLITENTVCIVLDD